MKKFLIALFVIGAAATVAAQDRDGNSISAARELYASARYDEALAVLNGIRPSDPAQPGDRKTIEQYRSLCLLALGRGEEAESAIAAVVTADPFFLPTESEASPRVRTAFTDVRTRLLPGIASSRYAAAKNAFDRKEHASAERQFRELIALLDDPQMNGRLGDLRTLAGGFLDLATAAAAPPPEPKKLDPPVPAAPAPSPAPERPSPDRIYTGEDRGVVPPVTIRQMFPSVPTTISGMTKERGMLDIVIDEQGRVVNMTLRSAIHPVYDTMLLNAAREWKYRPATVNGTPVKFRKLIQVTLPRR
jgi:hypothetical protein